MTFFEWIEHLFAFIAVLVMLWILFCWMTDRPYRPYEGD